MSQVLKEDRPQSVFKPLLDALGLYSHVIKITENQNVFDVKYKEVLTDKILKTADDIYIYARKANDIRVCDATTYLMRYRYQLEAINSCTEMMCRISIAKKMLHLRSRKVKHWNKLTENLRKELMAWKQADRERYKMYYQ